MGRKSVLDADKKAEAVMAVLRKEETVTQLARRYGVSEGSLYRWTDEFVAGGKSAMQDGRANGPSGEVARLKRELDEHVRCIGEITIANTILKKKLDRSL